MMDSIYIYNIRMRLNAGEEFCEILNVTQIIT